MDPVVLGFWHTIENTHHLHLHLGTDLSRQDAVVATGLTEDHYIRGSICRSRTGHLHYASDLWGSHLLPPII